MTCCYVKPGLSLSLPSLQEAIAKSAGEYLPNGIMPSLTPGEVVILAEGEYWITRDWKLELLHSS